MRNRDLPGHEVVPQIIAEVVALENEIEAISVVMVMKDKSVKTKMAYMEGTRLILLGGVDLFHHDMCSQIAMSRDNFIVPYGKKP